jgi:hypothetical protein
MEEKVGMEVVGLGSIMMTMTIDKKMKSMARLIWARGLRANKAVFMLVVVDCDNLKQYLFPQI